MGFYGWSIATEYFDLLCCYYSSCSKNYDVVLIARMYEKIKEKKGTVYDWITKLSDAME